MGKKAALLALLTLALPWAAYASIAIVNVRGVVSGHSNGLTLTEDTPRILAAGGAFAIMANGTNRVPNGVIFRGKFSSPAMWIMETFADGTRNYILNGALAGNGQVGATAQLTMNPGTGFFTGSAGLGSGDTSITMTHLEPGMLSLLGTGLLGLAGFIRRRQAAV